MAEIMAGQDGTALKIWRGKPYTIRLHSRHMCCHVVLTIFQLRPRDREFICRFSRF